MSQKQAPKDTKKILFYGIRKKCPNCGQGNLFKGYITQSEECSVCGISLSNLRADDGPAWLTILLSGHILAPIILYFVKHDVYTDTIETIILIILSLFLVFFLLPVSKGLFIAVLWMMQHK